MNNKTLKVVSVIALSLLVMIVIVIYTPKPATQDRVSRKTLDEQFQQLDKEKNRLLIINEVLGKANEAARKVNKVTDPSGEEVQFNDKGEPYLEVENIHPLIETNTKVIKELTKAVESVKLQRIS